MILAPTNRRVIRPGDKPSFEHTQRYGLIRGHWANTNRVGLWLFNQGSGGQVFDLSGNGNTGTFGTGAASPIWSPGKFGSAVSFDGGDYIEAANSVSLNPTRISIFAWVYANSFDNAFPRIVAKDDDGEGQAYQFLIEEITSTIGKLFFRIRDGASWYGGAFDTVFSVGNWYFVAGTYDGITIKGYVNDLQEPTTYAHIGSITTDTGVVRIGQKSNNLSYGWNGLIDIPSICNRALTASEIALLCREPFLGIQREPRITYFFVPTGGTVYQELNLIVTAAANVAKTDVHAMVDTGKAVQADASATESDTQQMVDTGKEVSADASVSESDTQQMVETGKAVEATASVSCTEIKVVFELNLTVTAAGSLIATDAHTMIETSKGVTAIASPAVIDTQAMVETGLGVSADASVSCTDSMGLLAHIAAFMILRQCTT